MTNAAAVLLDRYSKVIVKFLPHARLVVRLLCVFCVFIYVYILFVRLHLLHAQ